MKKNDFNEKYFLKLALIMAGIVMIFSAVKLMIFSYSSLPIYPQRNEGLGSDFKDMVESKYTVNDNFSSAAESVVSQQDNTQMLPNMAPVYEKNNDVVGWIKIDGTIIDYPVMYTKDDANFYLYRNFYKNKDINGSIFIDAHCSVFPRDTNLILHGHNMNNGSMFGALMKYKSQDFFKEHRLISFDTLYESQTYEVMAVFVSEVYNVTDNVFKYYRFYKANNQEEFSYFVDNIKRLSLYDTGVQAQYGDTFITLSTCENSMKNGRFVVVAKRINK